MNIMWRSAQSFVRHICRLCQTIMNKKDLWVGLNERVRKGLTPRNYKTGPLGQRIAESGVDAGEVAAGRGKTELKKAWIPGVEIFSREIHPQRHRGSFGELAREAQGVLGKIKLWPRQWSAARMFANSAKGFHIHPPSIPAEMTAEKWLRRLFVNQPQNYSLRPYDREQWDIMFFLQGRAEIFLRDVRRSTRAQHAPFCRWRQSSQPQQCGRCDSSRRRARDSGRRFGRCNHGLRNEHNFSAGL